MVSLIVVIGCILGVLVLVALVIVLALLMNSSDRDPISSARQGWIHRRSEKDEEGW